MPANKGGSRSAKERNKVIFAALGKMHEARWLQLRSLTKLSNPRLTAGLKHLERLHVLEQTWSKAHKAPVYRLTGLPLPTVTTEKRPVTDMKTPRLTRQKGLQTVIDYGGIRGRRVSRSDVPRKTKASDDFTAFIRERAKRR